MGRRRLSREIVLQALYLVDTSKVPASEAFMIVTAHLDKRDPKVLEFAKGLLDGTVAEQGALDDKLRTHATNWELGRMAAVDRNILRMAAYELLHRLDTPVSVVIDEALEIAKIFSTEDSTRFINGVLDQLKRYRPADGSAAPEPAPPA
jgi:transcription antitermination protein NusB